MKVLLFAGTCILAASAAVATLIGLNLQSRIPPIEDPWWSNVSQLDAGNARGDARFGHSLALDGELALVGAPFAKENGVGKGAAYVFPISHAEPHRAMQIGVADGTPLGGFGCSVALCGDKALVGAPEEKTNHGFGAAYLYQRHTNGQWNRTARFVPSGPATDDEVGSCVTLGEGIALVGTKRKQHSGVVYSFVEGPAGTWREAGQLAPDAGTSEEGFGWPLAVHRDLVAVGAYQGSSLECRGAVYLFQRDRASHWKKVAKITAPTDESAPTFGRSIAISDNAVLVGAPGYANGRAAALLFRRDHTGTWRLAAELALDKPTSQNSFGYVVAMAGNRIAVGAPLETDASGAVYLYQLDDQRVPQYIRKIALPDSPPDCWFGCSLAMDHDHLLVGAQYGVGPCPKSGAAYLFPLDNTP